MSSEDHNPSAPRSPELAAEEENRLQIIKAVNERTLTVRAAAGLLAKSERQVYRLMTRVKQLGSLGVVHRNKGRSPPNKADEETWHLVVRLVRERYPNLNDSELQRALERDHDIRVGRESLRKRLRAEGIPSQQSDRRRTRAAPPAQLQAPDPPRRETWCGKP